MRAEKRIVAIETSGRHGSVAILCGENYGEARLVGELVLSEQKRTAQSLAPALKELLKTAGWEPRTISLVAVLTGPGSFTGLRIGVTTAKTLAYACGAGIVGVNTLEAIAAQGPTSPAPLWTIADAQRQELIAARFVNDHGGQIRLDRPTAIVSQETWLESLRPGDRVSGPGLNRLAARLRDGIIALPKDLWHPMAATVGRLGWSAYVRGEIDDVWQMLPQYYRPSAAEEKSPPRRKPSGA